MEEIIAEFEAVMAEYNEAYTSTEDEKEQEEIEKRYEPIISKAESDMEAAIQAFNKTQGEALEKEQKEAEEEFEEEESEEKGISPLVKSFIDLVNTTPDTKDIINKYKEYELIEIGDYFDCGFTTKGTKKDKVEYLLEIMNSRTSLYKII